MPAPRRRATGAFAFVLIGFVCLFMLASSGGAWAASATQPLRGTVPTPTPRVTATKPAQPTPTPAGPAKPPTPTRIVPPTRTPCVNCTVVETIADDPVDILVNVGGDEYTDSQGRLWFADQEYVPDQTTWGYILNDDESGVFAGRQQISGTPDSPLYQDERWAMAGYRFEAPNGRYVVTLKFVEQFVSAAGQRVFTVRMQGADVLKDFDIVAAAGGRFMALDRVITLTVTSGVITVDFLRKAENPTLSAIAVQPILTPTPTRPPSGATSPEVEGTPTPTETSEPTATITPSPTATLTATPSPSTTGTALPAAARVVALFPRAGSALRSADGAVFIRIPERAVGEAMTLIQTPEQPANAPAANPGFALGSVVFSLQPVSASGVFTAQVVWQEPLTVTVRYSGDDHKAAGGELTRLIVMTYRPEAGQWLALETWADPANESVSARTRRAGLFALMIHQGATGAASQSLGLSWPVAVGGGGALLALVALVLGARRGRYASAVAAAENKEPLTT